VDRELSHAAQDLFDATLAWTRQWYDPSCALVWNPPGSGFGAARRVHLTPNSARFAYGLLAAGSPEDQSHAIAIVDRLISMQHPLDGGPAAGTYRIVLEAADLPPQPRMWIDYDPNWRQFVGTTFALIIEDFADRLPSPVVDRMLESIAGAVDGEPEDRIPVNYTNPALLRAWLDAWAGQRLDRAELIARGERFAGEIVREFDTHTAFDEFNSPTYYGVDLAALGLWREIPTTDLFTTEAARVESALWRTITDYYNPALRNFCGPYTRSYHPDATRSLAEIALWIWAAFGRDAAPLPDLTADVIDHSHDLMWGPIVARLARRPDVDWPTATDFAPRRVEQQLAAGRHVEGRIEPDLMIGVESSDHDWGGWEQFMPLVVHWSERQSVCVLTLDQPRVLHGALSDHAVELRLPLGPFPATFAIHAERCDGRGSTVSTGSRSFDVHVAGEPANPALARIDEHRWRLTVPLDESTPDLSLRFGSGVV
jgi:hypothetical protein